MPKNEEVRADPPGLGLVLGKDVAALGQPYRGRPPRIRQIEGQSWWWRLAPLLFGLCCGAILGMAWRLGQPLLGLAMVGALALVWGNSQRKIRQLRAEMLGREERLPHSTELPVRGINKELRELSMKLSSLEHRFEDKHHSLRGQILNVADAFLAANQKTPK